MGLRTHPSQRQRRLGVELRKLRDRTGMTAAAAGRHVDLSGAHLGHVESGRTPMAESKLRSLLTLYGVESKTFTEALVAWSTAPRGWWHDHRRQVSRAASDLAEAETLARSLRSFEPMHVPGLLQTPEYVSAVIRGTFPDATSQFVEDGMQFRVQRQEALSRHPTTAYHAIIHEAAFHMCFVGTEVMRRQISHLIEVATLPYVTVQLVPFRTGVLPAIGSPFVICDNAEPGLSTVYVEHDVGSVFLDEQGHLDRYNAIFEQLTATALPPVIPATERQSHGTRDSFSLLQYLLYAL